MRYNTPPQGHFRLLVLHAGTDDDPLRCSLCESNIDTSPKYEALRYEWGPRTSRVPITCNDRSVSITADAAAALRLFRSAGDKMLWMDQLCINQKNIDERREQVQLMYKIFGGASRVLMWLGPDSRNLAPVMLEFMNELRDVWEKPFDDNIPNLHDRLSAHGLPPIDSVKWEAYRALMGLPYFRRVSVLRGRGFGWFMT